MKKVSTVEFRNNFSDLVNRAAYGIEPVIITRRNKPLVAIVPVKELERLKLLEKNIS